MVSPEGRDPPPHDLVGPVGFEPTPFPLKAEGTSRYATDPYFVYNSYSMQHWLSYMVDIDNLANPYVVFHIHAVVCVR